jgi:hypothetical protein
MIVVAQLDIRPLQVYFNRYTGPQIAQRVALALEETAAKIAADAKQDVVKDTGMLAASIAYDVWGTSQGEMWGKVYSPLTYAGKVEFGTPPGDPPPAEGELLRWMDRHGIPPTAEYSIRMKIADQGIEPKPFLRPALEVNRQFFYERVRYYLFSTGGSSSGRR